MTDKIHEAVRERYARAARQVLGFAPQGGCSCGIASPTGPQAADSSADDARATDPTQAADQGPAADLQAALSAETDSCCDQTGWFGSGLYSALELGELPTAATRASGSWILARAAGSTSCCRHAGSARPARPTAWT